MIVDPTKSGRLRQQPPARLPGAAVPAVAVAALSIELRPLYALAGWPPCGALLEELANAARGLGGITAPELARLRTWAANYAQPVVSLRDFYERHLDNEAVEAALWWVLGTSRALPPGRLRGDLHRLWLDDCGHVPPHTLFPTPTHKEPHR